MITIRPEQPEDVDAIEELLITAFAFDDFSEQNEHRIVSALREEGALSPGLVAVSSVQGLVGMIAFSPVAISDGTPGWLNLGPIAVEPRFQRRGIGRHLMEQGLSTLRQRGAAGCVVIGDPEFHGRFGFASHPDLTTPEADPDRFLIQSFRDPVPRGSVALHPAFRLF